MIGTAINNNLTLNWLDRLEVGDIFQYPSSNPPRRSLICQGQAVSRTTYADLFAKIGTSYGTGDGSTTFNVPDMRGRVAQGIYQSNQTIGQKFSAGLPNISGKTTINIANFDTKGQSGGSGAIRQTYKTNYNWAGDNRFDGTEISIDASRSSSIYGNSTTVQPQALGIIFYIKY